MLQVFRLDVAKVDRDVAYVAMAIHVCFKCMFQMFHLFFTCSLQVFHLDVVYVSHVCCNYFIWMLHTFAMVFKSFHAFCKCFSCFVRMLQVFKLFRTNVASVSSGCLKIRSGYCTCYKVTHMSQPPAAVAWALCIHMGE
jgi:hypothetical protein